MNLVNKASFFNHNQIIKQFYYNHLAQLLKLFIIVFILICLTLAVWLSISQLSLADGNTVTVCLEGPPTCDYDSIQAAIDASGNNDTIKIAAGIYDQSNTTIYITKSIHIQGGYDLQFSTLPDPQANPTVLDAHGTGRVLHISGDITTTLSGLTITNGDATGLGGGLYPLDSYDVGGGLYILGANVTISQSQISQNLSGVGGGLYFSSCYLTGTVYKIIGNLNIVQTQIISNQATNWAGGFMLGMSDSASHFSHSTIAFNSPSGGSVFQGNATFTNNTISNNYGTGISQGLASISFHNNIIASNTGNGISTGAGDIMYPAPPCAPYTATYLSQVSVTKPKSKPKQIQNHGFDATNNVFSDNGGSGIRIGDNSGLSVANNTFIRNNDAAVSLSAYGTFPASLTMVNSIIVSHSIGINIAGTRARASLENTLWGSGHSANTQDWVLQESPTFSSTQNFYGDPAFAPDEFHLTASSAAIGRGKNVDLITDIDGDSRPQGCALDIGADEFLINSNFSCIYLPFIIR